MVPAFDEAVMFPSSSSFPTRAAFAPPASVPSVSRLLRSYAALRLPRLHRPRLRLSLAFGLPRRGCASWPRRPPPAEVHASGFVRRSPFRPPPWRDEGLPGAWVVLSMRAAAKYPAGCDVRLPIIADAAAAFESGETLSNREAAISELARRGPHPRLPTHRRSRCRDRRKADYRPAGLSIDRTGIAPAGRQTEFRSIFRVISLLSDQPCLVAAPAVPPAGACARQSGVTRPPMRRGSGAHNVRAPAGQARLRMRGSDRGGSTS